jgi:hypothetical protein
MIVYANKFKTEFKNCALACTSKKSAEKFWKENPEGVNGGPRVHLKCELSMVAGTGNNQAQYPEVLLIAPDL